MRKKRAAQSTLEYIIVLSAIIVAVIAASKGVVTNAVQGMFQDSANVITDNSGTFAEKIGTSVSK